MSVVNLNHRISSLSRRSHVIILLGIGVNCFITVLLLCSLLQGADLPLALSDPGQLRYGYGETSTSTSTSSISSSTSTSTRTITPLMPWASVSSISSHDSQDSLEVKRLLGCDHTNWGECVRAASKLASSQAVYAQQFATHKWQAFQRAMQGPTEYDSIKLFPYKHPVTVPLDPRFQPRPEWDNDRAFPDISICGLPKAGSSQLHTILKNHVGGVQFGRIKEQCTSRGDYRSIFEDWDEVPIDENQGIANDRQLHVQLQLYLYYEKLFSGEISSGVRDPRIVLDPSRRKTINGCYWINDIEISYHYLRPQDKKAIFLFRDPADWIWSAFNFWRMKEIDPKEHGWTNIGDEYRSPELFHELVASGKQSKWGLYSREYYHMFTIRSPKKLVALFGRENVLFLRNEDLLPEVVDQQGGVLDQLSNFTGLDRSQFDPATYSVVTNCNDNKGMKSVCNKTRSSSYALSGGREMLPETRTLIYFHFFEECKIWKRDYVRINIYTSSAQLDPQHENKETPSHCLLLFLYFLF
jgi:hypothetical protein